MFFYRYVSTKYINDCIEHNKQLNLDDYKLDSSVAKKYSTRVGNNNKPSYTALFGGIITFLYLVLCSLESLNIHYFTFAISNSLNRKANSLYKIDFCIFALTLHCIDVPWSRTLLWLDTWGPFLDCCCVFCTSTTRQTALHTRRRRCHYKLCQQV